MPNVVITGVGCISAIGNNTNELYQNLVKGTSGIKDASHLNSRYASIYPFGEIPISTESLRQNKANFTRTDLLALQAFKEAIANAQLSKEDLSGYRTAFVSGTSVGGMSETAQLYEDIQQGKGSNVLANSYCLGEHTAKIAELYGIQGYTSTINTACSSSANAIMLGSELILSGRADCVVVGGTDALAKYTVNGFNSLQILSDEKCKPFDKNRKGLNLGEAAAYLVLEDENKIGSKKVLGRVLGYSNKNDAHHASALNEDGSTVALVMSNALKMANKSSEDIDYINAHGTATLNNDFTELKGFQQVFNNVPLFSSTKGHTGHTLATAGALEAIISLLSINNGILFPTLNTWEPIHHNLILEKVEKKVNVVMSNSFGFAGNCSSIIFGKA